MDVLLIGKDWQARALLRAQLLEDGVSVEAWETGAEARQSITERPRLHRLIVADMHASPDPAAELGALEQWSGQVPVWIIASHSAIHDEQLCDRGFERVLFRPVDLGHLVEEIKQRLHLRGEP